MRKKAAGYARFAYPLIDLWFDQGRIVVLNFWCSLPALLRAVLLVFFFEGQRAGTLPISFQEKRDRVYTIILLVN
jgi:hypothetical protein